MAHTIFKIRIFGESNVPHRGPALLVSNHVSYLDAFLIVSCVAAPVRFVVATTLFQVPGFGWILRRIMAVPMGDGRGHRETSDSIRRVRQALAEGQIICIFAEGSITRTGNLLPFRRGMEKMVEGLDVPIVPVNLDGLWGSIFSFERGRFFWKRPKWARNPVTVSFGRPMPVRTTASELRQAVQCLAVAAAAARVREDDTLTLRFIRSARCHWSRLAMVDLSGTKWSYGQTLAGSIQVAAWARDRGGKNRRIGILLPTSIESAVASIGVTLSGHVAVHLDKNANALDPRYEIDEVLTSRKVCPEKEGPTGAGFVYVEDLFSRSGKVNRVVLWLFMRVLPPRLLLRRLSRGRRRSRSIDPVVCLPTGRVLSHHDLILNIEAMKQVFPIDLNDRILGVMALSDPIGLAATVWLPVLTGCVSVYHPDPGDSVAIGELAQRFGATVLLSTPSHWARYTRRCSREEFGSLRFALVGGMRIGARAAIAFSEKFGLPLLEAYSCGAAPLAISVNSPGFTSDVEKQAGHKPGTAGKPLPGVAVRIVDPVDMRPLAANQEGAVLIQLPVVNPEGWLETGDTGALDEEGFLRLARRNPKLAKGKFCSAPRGC